MATGGSIESVNIGGRLFAVAADADANRKLGGFEVETQPNGNGTGRKVKTRVSWAVSGLSLELDDDRGDQEYLQGVSDSNGFVPISVTYASGAVYQGNGTVSGELQGSSMNATGSVELSGPGEFKRQ